MDNSEHKRYFLAGLFFLGGCLLILGVVFFLGQDKGLTQPKFQVTVFFRDVRGLIEGAPVRLSGVNVGTVANIRFLDQEIEGRRVSVGLNIFKKYEKQLQTSAIFSIKPEGILGEKLVQINVDSYGEKINLKKPILGEESVDVNEMAEVFAEAARSFTKTSEDLNKIEFQALAEEMAQAANSLSETSEGITLMLKELEYITKKSKRLMNRIEQKIIDGTLFKVF